MAAPKIKIEEIVAEYHRRGQVLYGKKPDGTHATPGEREKAKKVRRIIEDVLPDVRSREKRQFGESLRARSFPIPRLTVEFQPGTSAGRLTYPDGSWRQYATFNFAGLKGLRDEVARLIIRGIVDVETTEVIVGGSARPLLTLMAD